MKIKKINKIKNLGIFKDFGWNNNLREFKRYNIFYGWNGSGKTTLTEIFYTLDKEKSNKFPDAEYEVELEDNTKINDKTESNFKIRVFNQDYINRNISLVDSKANPILLLGEESKELKEKINLYIKEKDKLEELIHNLTNKKNKLNKERGDKFTNVAKLIGENLTGSAVRNYRKNNAERDFNNLDKKELLTNEDLAKYKKIKEQKEKPNIEKIYFDFNQEEILQDIKYILGQSINSNIIDRLKNNSDIAAWVEQGIEIHRKHNSKVCEFCGQRLPENLIERLLLYFNDEVQKLKYKINNKLELLQNKLNELDKLNVPKKVEFYDDLYNDFESRLKTFNEEKIKFADEISNLINYLKDKRYKTNEIIEIDFQFNNKFKDALDSLNNIIEKHNNKTTNLQSEKDKAFSKIKKHYLSEIYDDIKEIDKEMTKIDEIIDKINNGGEFEVEKEKFNTIGLVKIDKEINSLESKISDLHKSVSEINKKLEIFLGRNEIKFRVSKNKDGFEILRNGEIAKNLSEGEKTAIAFVYFVVHLKDKNFDIQNGIIVIDDPISSFDDNSIFQAFAFMKEAVKDTKQVFIFTHNFDFLKLSLNWVKHSRESWSCYQIKNRRENQRRLAYIDKIDPLIEKFTTEYEYLFKILYDFNNSNPNTIEEVYNIPNIGRKVLETFLMFRIPNNENVFRKLKRINFDENKKTSIYKFFNDLSHLTGQGFHPSLVQEAKKNTKYLLEMIENSFKEHYDILVETINNLSNQN